MGNICAKKKAVEPTTIVGEANFDEEREVKSVVTRRATKGKGLLGQTSWSDDEDEEEEEEKGEESVAPSDVIAPLPEIKTGAGDDDVIIAKNQRISLMTKPQIPLVTDQTSQSSKLNVIYISNISQADIQSKMDDIRESCFNTVDGIPIEKESRICIYNGQLYSEHNSLGIDTAITSGEEPGSIDFPVLSRRSGCQLISQKHNEKIGILALDDIDESGTWLEFAKNEANKMLKHDQPNIIIAICQCGIIQAKKMAACNIPGIKCILCADNNLPSDETIELGTIIVTLNPADNQVAQLSVQFDEFHQPEFGATNFINLCV